MDKHAALARLSALEDEAKQLRRIIEAPTSLVEMYPGATSFSMHIRPDQAVAYSKALSTLILLRTQPGTVPPEGVITQRSVSGELQAFLEPGFVPEQGGWGIHVKRYSGVGTKLARISPAFVDDRAAYAALDAIGKEPLLKMFFTLHGFTPAA